MTAFIKTNTPFFPSENIIYIFLEIHSKHVKWLDLIYIDHITFIFPTRQILTF